MCMDCVNCHFCRFFPHLFTDVNECEEMTDTCHPDRAYCLNSIGGFHCICEVGYKLSDEEGCIGNVADSYGLFII